MINQANEGLKGLAQSFDLDPAQSSFLDIPRTQRNFISAFWDEAERMIDIALAKKEKDQTPGSIFIKANDQIVNLRLNDVLWIEAYGDYVNLSTEKKRYVVHSTMKSIESKLPKEQFIRVHRSFIIRTDKIDLIEESLIQIGKKLIPIGESYRHDFFSRLNIL